jgi:hypothetical protein
MSDVIHSCVPFACTCALRQILCLRFSMWRPEIGGWWLTCSPTNSVRLPSLSLRSQKQKNFSPRIGLYGFLHPFGRKCHPDTYLLRTWTGEMWSLEVGDCAQIHKNLTSIAGDEESGYLTSRCKKMNANEPADNSEHTLHVRLGLGDGSEQVRVREQVLKRVDVSRDRRSSKLSSIEYVSRKEQTKRWTKQRSIEVRSD